MNILLKVQARSSAIINNSSCSSNIALDLGVSNNMLHLTTHCAMSVLFFVIIYNLKDNISGFGLPQNITTEGASSCRNGFTEVQND